MWVALRGKEAQVCGGGWAEVEGEGVVRSPEGRVPFHGINILVQRVPTR